MVLDLFRRMIVGWLLAERESAAHAEHRFAETVARHGIHPGALTVHADRGSAMRSERLAQPFGGLSIERRFSHPRVSDDNAFSESHFEVPRAPAGLPRSLRLWTCALRAGSCILRRSRRGRRRRQVALDAAYAAHPEHFPNRPPVARKPPASVTINPLSLEEAASEAALLGCRDHLARGHRPGGDQLAIEAPRSLAPGRRDPELAAYAIPS